MEQLVLGFATSFLAGVVLWLVRDRVTYVTSRYPKLTGKWYGTFTMNGEERTELIFIRQQFLRRFRGRFLETTPEKVSTYKFRGVLLRPDLLSITFEPASRDFSDFGSAIVKMLPNHDEGHGAAVSLDRSTGEPAMMEYRMKR